jgi:hypothetical protein
VVAADGAVAAFCCVLSAASAPSTSDGSLTGTSPEVGCPPLGPPNRSLELGLPLA